jgi:hypothetical protein
MKNLISKFEHSDIFYLKPKKLTILLGTFVPFFACHVMAYSSSFKRDTQSGSKGEVDKATYSFFMLVSIVLFFVGYSLIISTLWVALSAKGALVSMKIFSILVSLMGYLAMNLLCTLLYYLKFRILKKENSTKTQQA